MRTIILTLLVFALSGCAQFSREKQEPVSLTVQQPTNNSHGEATGLVLSVEAMAAELLTNLDDGDPFSGDISGGMVVTTFVETKKLTRTSSFGRYLSEQLMNEFQRRSYPVIEIRKSTEIRVQAKRGEFGLARDEDELQTDIAADTMLTGTYFIGPDDIIVTARILNNKSAMVMASSTVIFPKNKLTTKMLADAASVKTGNPQSMYLKKLEL
jgi:TolB-like protein